MSFDLSPLLDNLPAIAGGLRLTIVIWLAGSALGMMLGLAVAILQRLVGGSIRAILQGYVAVLRGTPFLIQLFLLYYGGPLYGLTLPPLAAGIIGLSIYGSAYFAEIFRAGLNATPPGQIEAARVIGFTRGQIIRHVQLPQMLVIILPALTNMIVVLTKETAVLSVISVNELTSVVSGIGSTTFAFVETLSFLALVYWVLLEGITMVTRRLERYFGRFAIRIGPIRTGH